MTARLLPSLASAMLAFAALAHMQTVDFTARLPGYAIYYPYETPALLTDPAPPRPVDLPQRLVAALPTPGDFNRRGGAGAGIVVAVLAWLAAMAWTTSWLLRPIP